MGHPLPRHVFSGCGLGTTFKCAFSLFLSPAQLSPLTRAPFLLSAGNLPDQGSLAESLSWSHWLETQPCYLKNSQKKGYEYNLLAIYYCPPATGL